MAKELSFKLLGKTFTDKDNVTAKDAIALCGGDFEVTKEPLIRVSNEFISSIINGETPNVSSLNKNNIIQSFSATVRSDTNTTLGVVGKDYGIVQNTKAFDFIDFIPDANNGISPIINGAGSLGYGERFYISAKLGENMYLDENKKDEVERYIIFTNSHDGSGAVMAFISPIRVICKNTLNVAIRGAVNKIVFKHTKNVNDRLDFTIMENKRKATEVLSKSIKFNDAWLEKMKEFKSVSLIPKDVEDFAVKMFADDKFELFEKANRNLDTIDEISTRSKNQINSLIKEIHDGIGQNSYQGTKLWLLNGITTYLHNAKKYKSPEDEFVSMYEGDALKKTQKAYELLNAM